MPTPRITRIRQQKPTVARLPATGARRSELLTRRAAHYVLPPTDGTFSEWQSWGSEAWTCYRCEKRVTTRVHLTVCAPESGGYGFLKQCGECGYIHQEVALSRQEVIDKGRALRGWVPVRSEYAMLQREVERIRKLQRESVRAALRGSGGGGTGGRGA